jgi:DNA modification methylase
MRSTVCRGKLTDFPHLNSYTFGDSEKIMKLLPDKSADLVFTSPPDMSQTDMNSDQFYTWKLCMTRELSRLTKNTGFIVISQQDRKHAAKIQLNHVHYINNLCNLGWIVKDEKILVRNVFGRIDLYKFTYQYLSVFTKRGKIESSKRKGEWLRDIVLDLEDHIAGQYIWSQRFCRMVIETLTKPCDFVIDPFAGYGPVLYAAKELNRNYWGGENVRSRYNKDFMYFRHRQQDHFE